MSAFQKKGMIIIVFLVEFYISRRSDFALNCELPIMMYQIFEVLFILELDVIAFVPRVQILSQCHISQGLLYKPRGRRTQKTTFLLLANDLVFLALRIWRGGVPDCVLMIDLNSLNPFLNSTCPQVAYFLKM